MTSIDNAHKKIEELIHAVDDEEDLEEVQFEFEPFKKNMDVLLESKDLDSFIATYQKMCEENSAVIECFEIDSADALKEYAEAENKSLDDLKEETVNASCDILELIIFDVEADY